MSIALNLLIFSNTLEELTTILLHKFIHTGLVLEPQDLVLWEQREQFEPEHKQLLEVYDVERQRLQPVVGNIVDCEVDEARENRNNTLSTQLMRKNGKQKLNPLLDKFCKLCILRLYVCNDLNQLKLILKFYLFIGFQDKSKYQKF